MGVEQRRCAFPERGRRGLGRGGTCRRGRGGARSKPAPGAELGGHRHQFRRLSASPSHGCPLLALVALVGMASDPAASRREHSE